MSATSLRLLALADAVMGAGHIVHYGESFHDLISIGVVMALCWIADKRESGTAPSWL